ncbi:transposase [Rhizobium pusense]|nr:transposase [Agrobacterium pusense]MDH2092739.1 transposase [Agrobacterium pusense]
MDAESHLDCRYADKGYDGDSIREALLIHGIRPVIPPKASRKNPPSCDFEVFKGRNHIKLMFSRLKQFRRIATRYDKTRTSFDTFLSLAAAKIWSPHFTEPLAQQWLRSPVSPPWPINRSLRSIRRWGRENGRYCFSKIRDDLGCDYLHAFAVIIAEIVIDQEFEDNLVATPAAGNGGERR